MKRDFTAEKPFEKLTTDVTEFKVCNDKVYLSPVLDLFNGRLKVEMFYGELFESVEDFIQSLDDYIYYYNHDRISLKLKGMSPVQYRTHSQAS